jgi:hypothetical protein
MTNRDEGPPDEAVPAREAAEPTAGEEQAAQDPREREPEMIAYREAQERRAGRSG